MIDLEIEIKTTDYESKVTCINRIFCNEYRGMLNAKSDINDYLTILIEQAKQEEREQRFHVPPTEN